MPYYHTCSICGATLDPGEKCDCRDLEALREQAKRKAPCVPADQSTTQRA